MPFLVDVSPVPRQANGVFRTQPIIVYKRKPCKRSNEPGRPRYMPRNTFENGREIRWAASPREWKNFPKSAARWTLNRVKVIT